MKVKIKNKIYDSEKEPIMIVLSESDKTNISNMSKEYTKYLSFPDKMNQQRAKRFMKHPELI